MIIPEPESDLSLNTMILASDIIEILDKNKIKYIVLDKLLRKFLKHDKRRNAQMLFDSIIFLYILGVVEEKDYKVRLMYDYTQRTLL